MMMMMMMMIIIIIINNSVINGKVINDKLKVLLITLFIIKS